MALCSQRACHVAADARTAFGYLCADVDKGKRTCHSIVSIRTSHKIYTQFARSHTIRTFTHYSHTVRSRGSHTIPRFTLYSSVVLYAPPAGHMWPPFPELMNLAT
jgi:hypothetical protein